MEEHARDLVAASIGQKMAYGGGSTALIFGLAASDFAAIAGVVIALAGLGIQIYYKRRADRRETLLNEAQLAEIKRGEG